VFGPSHVDLTSDPLLLTRLLRDPRSWRERLVQEFVFAGDTTEVRVNSSYQVRFDDAFLRGVLNIARPATARMVLPLGTRDKELLLRVDAAGPGHSPAALVSRHEGGERQAKYLFALLLTSGSADAVRAALELGRPRDITPGQWPLRLLEGVCRFTPSIARAIQEGRGELEGLALFLREGPGRPSVEADHVRQWLDILVPAADHVAGALGEPSSLFSSAENPLLAASQVAAAWDRRKLDTFVRAYEAAVRKINPRDPFLRALAEYGRRYEVMVEATVPLREPFAIQLAEDRPMHLTRKGVTRQAGLSEQRMALGDARSVHVEARIDDHAVEFSGQPVINPVIPLRAFPGWRSTKETIALYYTQARPVAYAQLRVKLRPTSLIRQTTVALVGLDVLALLAILLAPRDPLYVERLAVLVLPTTVAAALVLAREHSALSAHLQVHTRRLLGLTILALWIVAIAEVRWFPFSSA